MTIFQHSNEEEFSIYELSNKLEAIAINQEGDCDMLSDNFKQQGFTIIELLLLLSLLAIVTLSSYPFGSSYKRSLLKSSAREVLALFSYCQTHSLLSGNRCRIEFLQSKNKINTFSSEEKIGSVYQLPKFISIRQVRFGALHSAAHVAQFSSNGVSSPGKVILEDKKGGLCTITLALRGAKKLKCS